MNQAMTLPGPVGALIDLLLGLDAQYVVGGLMVALVLAVTTAGVYRWAWRGKADATTALAVLVLASNVIAMAVGAAFIRALVPPPIAPAESPRAARGSGPALGPVPLAGPAPLRRLSRLIVEAGDIDGDGRLSEAEAGGVGARLYRTLDEDSRERLDAEAIYAALYAKVSNPGDPPLRRAGPRGVGEVLPRP